MQFLLSHSDVGINRFVYQLEMSKCFVKLKKKKKRKRKEKKS